MSLARRLCAQIEAGQPLGRLAGLGPAGLDIEGFRPPLALGERIEAAGLLAEVVSAGPDKARALPFARTGGLRAGQPLRLLGPGRLAVGPGWLGRVVDPLGTPLDGKGTLPPGDTGRLVAADPPPAGDRARLGPRIGLGVRALDLFCTLREGQRIGLFAASGIGKSTLLAMLAGAPGFDVAVLGLVGERGRELREFIEDDLGLDRLARSVVVCATSDKSSMERAKAAYVATAIAEYFRDQGKRVLFLMDSVTRFARAQREIGLAAGEPPTRRGYPPSVFATLPKLMERVGMNETGSITALYTVLVEGDDMTEPIADETRSILDGHIVLSRKLASANHYPAVDVLASASRVMNQIVSPEHRKHAGRLRELMAKYAEVELLVKIGEYQRGGDATTDEAIDSQPQIQAFLRQGTHQAADWDETLAKLKSVVRG
jgi:type III secretion protein N (ATPase)